MGVQVSKELRSRLEHSTLEELLANDKCISELQRHLPKLPKRSQNNLAKILSLWEKTLSGDSGLLSKPNPPPKDRNSRTFKLSSLWSTKSDDITIPDGVVEALKQSHCNLLRHWPKNEVALQSPADHYEYTCSVETRRTLDRILWRFLTTSYHDIIQELNQQDGLAFVVAVICQSRKHDPDAVRERVIGWAKVGRRYRGFMQALCSGCIILFPERISDLLWEQYVPVKGETFEQVIQFLQNLGIVNKCEEAGWNDLSDEFLDTLRAPFRCLIPFQFQPGQQSQIGWVSDNPQHPAPALTNPSPAPVPAYLISGFNSATASRKRKNEQIADTRLASDIRKPRTASTTTNHNSTSTLSSNEVSTSSISSHTISPSSPGDANSLLSNLVSSPQSSRWTASSSERRALINVPSIAERNQVQSITGRPRVSHSLSLPQALLVSENLFHNVKVYFENSCRNMILDDHGTLLTPNGVRLQNNLCNDFDSYCFTATMLKQKGLHVEFRRALSKASALVEQILRAEHPRTLACFLEVFIHLIQTGLRDVASSLRDFIRKMSAKVTREGHHWGQICRLLGELDSKSLDQAMAQTWKCITDTFDSELGTLNPLAVSVRLDYIKRVYGSTDHFEGRKKEERVLRELLAQFRGIPSPPPPRVMLNLAHNLNRQERHEEAEEMALEVLSLFQKYEIYAERTVERIELLKIVSRSQFHQGKTLAAEQSMRKAIRMIVDQWGKKHSWIPEFMNVLEGWLRGWGREEDANTLRSEIEELMGED